MVGKSHTLETANNHTQPNYSYLLFKEISLFACKVLKTLVQYFTVCTYFWMLCEGKPLLQIQYLPVDKVKSLNSNLKHNLRFRSLLVRCVDCHIHIGVKGLDWSVYFGLDRSRPSHALLRYVKGPLLGSWAP